MSMILYKPAADVLLSKDITPTFCQIIVIGKTSKNASHYLGLELNQNIQNITLDQIRYISLLQLLNQKLIIIEIRFSSVSLLCDQTRLGIFFGVC